MSHDELDEAPELDAGDPRELAGRVSRRCWRCCRRRGCSAAAAAPITGTSARSAMPAARRMRPEAAALRPARPGDAADLARLVELASEGLTSYLWARMAAPGEEPLAFGAARAARDEGGLLLAERGDRRDRRRRGGRARQLPDRRGAGAARRAAGDVPAAAGAGEPGARARSTSTCSRPIRRSGAAASRARCWPRRSGWGRTRAGLSLIVADRNAAARRLYDALGFAEAAREAMVKEDWRLGRAPPGC